VSPVKLIALDVDGTLTDGGFWWGADGEELKRFSFLDVMGISRATKAGTTFALISGEEGSIVDRFARKIGARLVYMGCRDKAAALRQIMLSKGLEPEDVCYMGDDLNDLPAMAVAGYSAAPANAVEEVRAKATYVCTRQGGNGAVRELLDHLQLVPLADSEQRVA
jgi:3-deoxy-D-manno-octulosonate 8-phosphate phosphatase (KDO 8-P phosphatase)